jgi:hypothetical protein
MRTVSVLLALFALVLSGGVLLNRPGNEKAKDTVIQMVKPVYEAIAFLSFAEGLSTDGTPGRTMYREPRAGERPARIYVREYSNYRPPNGAPLFYAPFPNTLCMLGETSEGPGVIYEAAEGACTDVILKWVMIYHQSQE